ncbi:MAG: TauD/TfdA family dioxygenase [Polyangiaceae bacterium]
MLEPRTIVSASSYPVVALQNGYSSRGLLLEADPGQSFDAIDARWLMQQLKASGYLLLRGFDANLEAFCSLVRRHSSRVSLDPARSFHGGNVAQKVDAGTDAMGLHLENGNSPFRPDLVWFYCERAARQGSQTTVCDGCRVWERMTDFAREQFHGSEFLYRRRVDEQKWKRFVQHQTADSITLDQIQISDLMKLVDAEESTTIEDVGGGAIVYSYRASAVHQTLFGSGLAWANSIFGPSYNYEAPQITFADGHAIPGVLLEEMRTLTADLTEDIDWHSGDIVLIDNTRVMHGRRSIVDTGRKIFNALSYIDARFL